MRLPVTARRRTPEGADGPVDRVDGAAVPADDAPPARKPKLARRPRRARRPFYARLLHLRHISPNAWQRALLGEGSLALAVVLVLADLATAWTLLVLPVAVAALVKAHDLLARLLGRPVVPTPGAPPERPAP